MKNRLLVFAPWIVLVPILLGSLQLVGAQFEIKEEASGDIAVLIDGELFTRYVISDRVTNKCYFWPIIGPGGVIMTRAFPMEDVPDEKQDHPHHRSVCFGLQNAGGFNTWHETMTFTKNGKVDESKLPGLGYQVHRGMEATTDEDSATLILDVRNVTPDGKVYLKQTRIVRFHVDENENRIMDVEIRMTGVKDAITIYGKKDSGLTVRVAHSMCVEAGQGGRIINSNGDRDGAAWGKRVPWVDFNGPVEGKRMGIAMLNHPDSFRYPTPWHVRNYGLFTANAFALKEVAGESESGDFELREHESIVLKHRIIFHSGDELEAKIAEAWDDYARE